ncbi:uncharacterized protein L969DRAFT_93241 [Mixia osmundae IAM 14324]|uniref:Amino acid transporter transmembrane domain-containing protein n=1 Tax=Mixia osmundae (strain CBS 9802 / IAM 14324 / JCM 22182 / KY 12970) TaxID=764103 RepID=G7E5N8_MIXOS|nr:uncharacterized protein L969DRAFT_93241 [Mixia osmundae IAM 14324]KEI40703.1 hypothetical protein L969DRAFT_93241 [Mixia osmundae IAM 14324]GAA98148.1 hypothetical protein E5Q_04831 [Mixia osmundae IAM 14324]
MKGTVRLEEEEVLFTIEDTSETTTPTSDHSPQPPLSSLSPAKPAHQRNPDTHVRFATPPAYRDSVDDEAGRSEQPVYPPPPVSLTTATLASTLASREAQFELDSDQLSEADELHDTVNGLPNGHTMSPSSATSRDRVPLLHEARGRLSLDGAALIYSEEEGQIPGRHLSGEEDLSRWLDQGGGLISGMINMINATIGAGAVGLPYALREAGLFTGVILLLALGAVTDWTIRLIILNAKLSGQSSYVGILDTCFGFRGRVAVSFFQFTFAFGGMCAFGVILGDTIPHVLVSLFPALARTRLFGFLFSRQFVIAFFTSAISYPLSLYRDIHKLARASALALVSMLIILLTVSWRGSIIDPALRGNPEQRFTVLESGVFESIGVISFAFVCHHNSLLIYGSLKTPTLDRFARVTHVSTAISVAACLIMALSGFLVFTDKTQGNILNNFPPDDFWINIARACFGFNMFTTLPLEAFVCREVIESFFFAGRAFDQKRHIIITTVTVAASLLVALTTCNLGVVLELTGGFAATSLAYIFPAVCYLRLSGNPTHPSKWPAWACAGFGVIVMILSTVLSLRKAAERHDTQQC